MVSMFFFAKKSCCFRTTWWSNFHIHLRPEVPYMDKKPKFRTACLILVPQDTPQGRFSNHFKRTSSKQPASFRTWMVLRPRLTYPPNIFSWVIFRLIYQSPVNSPVEVEVVGISHYLRKGFIHPRWFTRRSSEPSTVTKGTLGFWDSKNKRYQVHVGPSDLGGEESWFLENHSNWQQHQSR